MHRVLVTGVGLVVPHGQDFDAVWDGVRQGQSRVARIRAWDPSEQAVQIAAEVQDFDGPGSVGGRPVQGRSNALAMAALQGALADAGLPWEPAPDPRLGLVVAHGLGSDAFGACAAELWRHRELRGGDVDGKALLEALLGDVRSKEALLGYTLDDLVPLLALASGAVRVRSLATACASGSQAIAEAAEAVAWGRVDRAIAGASSAPVDPAVVPGFAQLSVLSTRNDEPERASRPFDMERAGFVMGEGAAFLVLESEELARRRGVPVYGEIAGWGLTCDAWRLTDPMPEGVGMRSAMGAAMARAQVGASEVVYVNAHGTSTRMNDSIEAQAIHDVFEGKPPPVSSSKSMFGHLIHSAGVLEAIVCLGVVRDGVAPPTLNVENLDPACPIDPIAEGCRELGMGPVLSNSFGFGGQNACLLIRGAER